MTAQVTKHDGQTQVGERLRHERTRKRIPLGSYIRVSRQGEREDDRFRSPEFQAAHNRRWAEGHGRELREYPPEIDVSGSKKERPILEELVQAIERRELGGILVARLDRLSRLAPRERIELFDRIESAGGEIVSASENLDASTPEGRFAREVFLGVARMQWEQKAADFAIAKAAAVERGTKIASVAPFGYRFSDDEHKLVPVEDEAELVVDLFELRAAGASRGEILRVFEERTGRSSYRQTIAYMLGNRAYLGEVRYGRERELVNVSAHPAIVELDLFERVQQVERERSSGPGSGGRPKALLAGIARCASCGRGLACSRTGSARRLSYKCPADTRHCDERASIGAAELDKFVTDAVLEWAGPAADELVEVALGFDAIAPRIELEARLGEARALLVAHEENVELEIEIGADAYAKGRAARVALVERRERELEAAGEASEIEVARVTLRAMLDAEELDVAERRRLFRIVLDRVLVRRTPRRGAPAEERARIVLATEAPAALDEDPAELVEQTAA